MVGQFFSSAHFLRHTIVHKHVKLSALWKVAWAAVPVSSAVAQATVGTEKLGFVAKSGIPVVRRGRQRYYVSKSPSHSC